MTLKNIKSVKEWAWDELERLEKRRFESKLMPEQYSLDGSLITVRKLLNAIGEKEARK